MSRQGSAAEAIGLSIGHVKTILFRPFDMARWVTLGFIAWLAYLGENGYSFRFPNPWGGGNEDQMRELGELLHEVIVLPL